MFRAEIADLVPGLYDIVVQYQGKVIGRERVFLPLSSISQYFELPSQATLEAHAPGGGLEVYVRNGSEIKVLDPGIVVKAKLKGSDMKLHPAYLQFNEASRQTMVETNNVPAIVKVSPNCQLKLQDSRLFLHTNYRLLPVSVMPDEAVSMLKVEPRRIELKVIDDKAVYEIQGVTHKKFLGFLSRDITIEAQVDAVTGEITNEQEPWWANLCW